MENFMRGREYFVLAVKVLSLAQLSGCTAYDYEYVALAEELGVKLLTEDKQLLTAFPKTAISLNVFLLHWISLVDY